MHALSELVVAFGPPAVDDIHFPMLPQAMLRGQKLVWDKDNLYYWRCSVKKDAEIDTKKFPSYAWQIDFSPSGPVCDTSNFGVKGLFLALATRLVPPWEPCSSASVATLWETQRSALFTKTSNAFKPDTFPTYEAMMVALSRILKDANEVFQQVMRSRLTYSQQLWSKLPEHKAVAEVCLAINEQYQHGTALMQDIVSDFLSRLAPSEGDVSQQQIEFFDDASRFLGGLLHKCRDDKNLRVPPTIDFRPFARKDEKKPVIELPRLLRTSGTDSPETRGVARQRSLLEQELVNASSAWRSGDLGSGARRLPVSGMQREAPGPLQRVDLRQPSEGTSRWEDHRAPRRGLFLDSGRHFGAREGVEQRRSSLPVGGGARWSSHKEVETGPPPAYDQSAGSNVLARDRWAGRSLLGGERLSESLAFIPVSAAIILDKGVEVGQPNPGTLCTQGVCRLLGPHFPFECPALYHQVFGALPPGFRWSYPSGGDRFVDRDHTSYVALNNHNTLTQQTSKDWASFIRRYNVQAAPNYFPGILSHPNYPPSFSEDVVAAAPLRRP